MSNCGDRVPGARGWPDGSRAKPRASSGWPLRSAHGAASRACSRARMSSVVMARLSPKMARRSASSRMPRLMPRSALSRTSQVQAARARSGQGPPAASATASRGSHTSAGRSVTPGGMSGQ